MGGYTIAYAMLLISGARSGDRFGRRRTYLAGVIIFTAASLACALAPDSQALVAFRFVQGAGAAALVPQVFSIIQLTFSGPGRARALSAYAAGWPAWCLAGIAVGAALAVVFVLLERRVAARGGEPLLNLDVLRAPALPSGLAALALTQVAYGGVLSPSPCTCRRVWARARCGPA